MPSAISASSSASVPDDTAIACVDAEQRRQLALERVDLRPHDEALAVADARDRREDLVAQRPVLRVEIEQGHLHRHGAAILTRPIAGITKPHDDRRRTVIAGAL